MKMVILFILLFISFTSVAEQRAVYRCTCTNAGECAGFNINGKRFQSRQVACIFSFRLGDFITNPAMLENINNCRAHGAHDPATGFHCINLTLCNPRESCMPIPR